MKTIIIGTSKFGNPISNYYKSLGECFQKHNYRVVYIFDGLFNDYPEENENLKFYTWKNKRPTKIADFLFFWKILKKEKPVLCISNFGSTNIMTIASYFFKVKNRVNYVHTTSKSLILETSKNAFIYKFFKIRKQLVYNLNTHLFANSNGTKQDTIDHYHIPAKKITILPLLIKSSSVEYASFQQREKSICIVGRFHPTKGHREFLFLFQKCLDKYPDIKLKLVGDGYLKQELVELTKTLKIENNVIFTGKIPNEEVGKMFSTSLISISSSVFEAYGLVNIEALREGTPLICTRTAGSSDIIDEEVNGLFFNLDDNLSLLSAIEKILENWDYFSKNALNSFKQKYSTESIENHFNIVKNFT